MADDPIARIERSLVALVRRATDPRGNRQINVLAGVDIERAASVMLARIEELEPARLSQLADAVGVDISTASRQVARLVEAGLVARGPDPDDGRASAHRLTESGVDLRRRLAAARRAWFEQKLEEFSPVERRQFAELLERFMERMGDDEASRASTAST